jgi:hypothetical protein
VGRDSFDFFEDGVFDAAGLGAGGRFELDDELARQASGFVGGIDPVGQSIFLDESAPKPAASPAREDVGEDVESGTVWVESRDGVPADEGA